MTSNEIVLFLLVEQQGAALLNHKSDSSSYLAKGKKAAAVSGRTRPGLESRSKFGTAGRDLSRREQVSKAGSHLPRRHGSRRSSANERPSGTSTLPHPSRARLPPPPTGWTAQSESGMWPRPPHAGQSAWGAAPRAGAGASSREVTGTRPPPAPPAPGAPLAPGAPPAWPGPAWRTRTGGGRRGAPPGLPAAAPAAGRCPQRCSAPTASSAACGRRSPSSPGTCWGRTRTSPRPRYRVPGGLPRSRGVCLSVCCMSVLCSQYGSSGGYRRLFPLAGVQRDLPGVDLLLLGAALPRVPGHGLSAVQACGPAAGPEPHHHLVHAAVRPAAVGLPAPWVLLRDGDCHRHRILFLHLQCRRYQPVPAGHQLLPKCHPGGLHSRLGVWAGPCVSGGMVPLQLERCLLN